MLTLKEAIKNAEKNKVALGHFNIADSNMFWGVVGAAHKLNVPVVIGISEGERDFIGLRQAVALVGSVRDELSHPIFLNADHTYSLDGVKEAVGAGVDSVIFDGAKLTPEENVKLAKQSVEYVKESGRDALVEAELGYIGTSSKLLDNVPEGASVTDDLMPGPDDARKFVEDTGVDLLAPAVGNLHGMLKNAKNPSLDIERIAAIREAGDVPLVLHGGSGISDEDFVKAIDAGVSMIHVSTEVRLAYRDGIKKSLQENPDELAPYRFLKPAVQAVQSVVEEKIKLFNKLK